MRRWVAMLFLFTYMATTTELLQLLKMPVLVEHFLEHRTKNPGMSISDFLSLHYDGNHLENHPHDDDFEQDQKLPFIVYSAPLSFCCIQANDFLFNLEDKTYSTKKLDISIDDDLFVENQFLASIWQPPKTC